jgi:hypothetical protein
MLLCQPPARQSAHSIAHERSSPHPHYAPVSPISVGRAVYQPLTEAACYHAGANEKPVSFALMETTRSPAPAQLLELILRGGERLYIPAEQATLRLRLPLG